MSVSDEAVKQIFEGQPTQEEGDAFSAMLDNVTREYLEADAAKRGEGK